MSFEPRDYLQHVLAEADYLLRESSAVTEAEFFAYETLQRAFVRSVEVIGEATKQIPDDFRRAHREIDWRGMAGMRDRLIHGYFGVDYAIVWDVVQNHIPRLQRQIQNILRS
jgi:uncharacterized protein with HEPN domain